MKPVLRIAADALCVMLVVIAGSVFFEPQPREPDQVLPVPVATQARTPESSRLGNEPPVITDPSPSTPAPRPPSPAPRPPSPVPGTPIWHTDLAAAESEARRLNRPLLIAFSTEGCAPCLVVKRDVYQSAHVVERLRNEFVRVWIYVTAEGRSLATARRFGVRRYPTVVVLGSDGGYRAFVPRQTPAGFLSQLDELRGVR